MINFSVYLKKSMDYPTYRALFEKVVEEKRTTGPIQNEEYAHYTRLNWQRHTRLEKTIEPETALAEAVRNIKQPLTWLTLTETWCGDAAQNIPYFEKLTGLNPNITTRYLLRDENTELMDRFLTNGGRSIPKVIVLDENQENIATWGPRPEKCQQFIDNMINKNPSISKEEWIEEVQRWYITDKGQSLQEELTGWLRKLAR